MSVGVDGLGDSIAPEETTSDEETDSCVVNGAGANVIPVSYTHLTLPTSDLV